MSFRHFLGFVTLFALLPPAAAAPPTWWATGNPPIITGTEANNRAPATIGQAKWMVTEALRTLDTAAPTLALQIRADLAGTAPDFTNRIIDLTVPNPKSPSWLAAQKSPLLLGQLKAISAPFYTRLAAAYPTWLTTERTTNATNLPNSIFPWTTTPDDDQNKATATLGQLKAVFSLRFETLPPPNPDLDGDGMPNLWEIANGLDPLTHDAAQDPDRDGYTNLEEYQNGTNPRVADTIVDTDNDGMPDRWETLYSLDPYSDDSMFNPDEDTLADATPFTNLMEFQADSDPQSYDTDSDGMPDGWEASYSLNLRQNDGNLDPDADSQTNREEYTNNTNPRIYNNPPDTDNDGMSDAWEWKNGLNPSYNDSDQDPDRDGYTNLQEYQNGTNPHAPNTFTDSDNDGLPDSWEVSNGLSTTVNNSALDPDGDGLTNLQEFKLGTKPNSSDTDADTLKDGEDADPTCAAINWTPGPAPGFAVIELKGDLLANAIDMNCMDFTEKGTIYMVEHIPKSYSRQIVINSDGVSSSHNFGGHTPAGVGLADGIFWSWGGPLIGEKVLGYIGGEGYRLWDPLTLGISKFEPWVGGGYEYILDHRDGISIWFGPHPSTSEWGYFVRTSINGARLPGPIELQLGGAAMERNRNILGHKAYWRWDAASNTYPAVNELPPDTSLQMSATLERKGSQLGQIIKWNLVATNKGLAIAENNGAFKIATGNLGQQSFTAVTEQGWIFRHATDDGETLVWNSGKWTNLYEFLGDPTITSAAALKTLDTGHIVARLRRSQGPYFIARLLPVEVSLRATGNLEPAPENDSYQDSKDALGGTDVLGPLPMGTGRRDAPGQAYTAPIQVIGKVPKLPNIDWRWKRFITRRSWTITMNGQSTGWTVSQRSKRGAPPPPDDDTGSTIFYDETPSSTTGKIYFADGSALAPAQGAVTAIGDFVYEEKQFTYQIETNAGGAWTKAAELDVGQTIIAKRITAGNTAAAFQGIENSNQIRKLDAIVTEAEVRNMVGGTLPITFDATANN